VEAAAGRVVAQIEIAGGPDVYVFLPGAHAAAVFAEA
jgi:hypothetical protein